MDYTTSFNETHFINSIIHQSYINDTIHFRGFIREYISKNSEEVNIMIIRRYGITLENAMNIYDEYYRYIAESDSDNIIDLTSAILYHTFYDDILAKILDDGLDSDCETDVE